MRYAQFQLYYIAMVQDSFDFSEQVNYSVENSNE